MITIENSENLCNMIFKKMLDLYNEEPTRLDIVNLFSKEFENVRLTLYDDIIVFLEINGQSIFISQLGVFRYIDLSKKEYLSLADYLSLEYLKIFISMDIYCKESNVDELNSNLKYRLVPLIGQDEDGITKILDKNLDSEFLYSLYEYMSLYNSVLKVAKVCYPAIL